MINRPPAHHIRFANIRRHVAAFLGLTALLWIAAADVHGAWQVNGSAYAPGGDPNHIVITPEANDRAGSAWLDFPLELSLDFDLTLAVNLGTRDADGADGLSIVLQNDPRGAAAVGDTAAGGEWVGLHGIQYALAVEVDTWQNASRGDPACDHIGIDEIRNASSLPDHSGAGPQCADPGGANIEDGSEHLVRLLWISATHTLTVYWDGVLRFTYTNTNIENDIFNGAGSVWFGVVGSTGGAYNLQQFRSIVTSSSLAVTKSVSPTSIDPGDPLTYTVTIDNNSTITAFVTQIEDQLPTGFAYLPGTAAGLTTDDPAAAGQTLTWNGAWILNPGQSAVLTFQAQGPTVPGVYLNTVVVRGANFLEVTSGATAAITVGSDLSSSTKTVNDLNGGDPEPGDVLRYTITFNESAGRACSGVGIVDNMPPNVTNLTVLSLPSGAVDGSTGSGTGNNGTGRLQVTGINLAAGGTATIEFEVTIDPSTPNGVAIDNTAVITNPTGVGASPVAPTVTVVDPSVPASGSKPLYFYTTPGNGLSRTPPTAAQPALALAGNGDSATWTLTPAIAAALTISGDGGFIPVEVYLYRNNRGTTRDITLRLFSAGGEIDATAVYNQALPATATRVTFQIPISGDFTLPPGDTLSVTITNNTNRTNRTMYVDPVVGSNYSRMVLTADTVINVDQVAFYDGAYAAGTQITSAAPGQTLHIRAAISDPFGSFDITAATLDLEAPDGSMLATGAAMTEAWDSGSVIKIYEYAVSLPIGCPEGIWTARVTGLEGSEGLVTHTRTITITVNTPPSLTLVKSADSAAAPPGTIVTYTVQLANSGGTATNVVVDDHLSPYTALRVAYDGSGSLPFQLSPAGLGTAEYSRDNGVSFTSNPPTSGAGGAPSGFDGTVTNWRIVLSADLAAGANDIIRYQVVIK